MKQNEKSGKKIHHLQESSKTETHKKDNEKIKRKIHQDAFMHNTTKRSLSIIITQHWKQKQSIQSQDKFQQRKQPKSGRSQQKK